VVRGAPQDWTYAVLVTFPQAFICLVPLSDAGMWPEEPWPLEEIGKEGSSGTPHYACQEYVH
jgi:hypothetical protein